MIRNIEQNLFQVINESHFDEILENNMQNMIIVMLGSKECGPCKVIKPKFVELSKHHKDVFFIYIDRSNYQLTNNKYFNEFAYTPTFVFYFGGNKIAFVEGAHEQSLLSAINVLKQKIEQKRNEVEQRERMLEEQKKSELEALNLLAKLQSSQQSTSSPQQPSSLQAQLPTTQELHQQSQSTPPSQSDQPQSQQPSQVPINEELILLNKKIELLQYLRNMTTRGIKLTKNYNLDSSLEELMFEYQFQTNPQFRQHVLSQQSPQTQQSPQPQSPQQPPQQLPQLPSQQVTQPSQQPPAPESQQQSQIDHNNELLKKQEQVRQIKELDLLNQRMQAQSFQKLQQLRKLQQMKEEQEKNNEKQ